MLFKIIIFALRFNSIECMQRFYPEITIATIVLEMTEAVFETRAIPVWHILIFAILCFYMVIGVFALVRGIAGWPLIFIFFIFFGSLFFLFLFSILFSKLKVYEDGISFRTYHRCFDEMGRIELKWGGRILVFGWKWDWYLLLNPQRFIEAVKAVKPEALIGYGKPVRRRKSLIYSMIPLASLVALWAIGYALGCIGVVIDPFVWALVWGIAATLSTTVWVYCLPPHRYRILNLGRLGTSIAMGLAIGIPIFLITLTRLFM